MPLNLEPYPALELIIVRLSRQVSVYEFNANNQEQVQKRGKEGKSEWKICTRENIHLAGEKEKGGCKRSISWDKEWRSNKMSTLDGQYQFVS